MRIAALFAGAAFLFFGCENNIEKIKAFSSSDNLPDMEAATFETMFTDSGEVRFFLKAPTVLHFDGEGKPYFEFPDGIELIKYDEHEQVISSITADYAKQFEKEEKWEAKNNVVATNAQGDTLKTEHLIWEEKDEKIHTEEFVRIIRENQIITGIGFQSDQSLQNWRIKNPKGTIYIDMENPQPQPADSVPPTLQEAPKQNTLQKPLNLGN
ncbi:LPS export ABC transporter periplasmic protein LptC [Mariniphaga anaerophila]|uniref:LPS export ABC transporter periplasmic protein LptC n=1 Tax=Mariniphaga anaerophila TaxID=1484053 RepID=UPI0015872650|nr:LPS export ABC transporter periplasmic protein LptC [Mariniphaga anaerophila]